MANSIDATPWTSPPQTGYVGDVPPESSQFDFLVGSWAVNASRFASDGLVLSSFVTLRTYVVAKQRWEMVGLPALQSAMKGQWTGVWDGSTMRLLAISEGPSGRTVQTRIRFFNIQPDCFSWDSESSVDGGQTWLKTATLSALRLTSP